LFADRLLNFDGSALAQQAYKKQYRKKLLHDPGVNNGRNS
jgi:hypothetical protein